MDNSLGSVSKESSVSSSLIRFGSAQRSKVNEIHSHIPYHGNVHLNDMEYGNVY